MVHYHRMLTYITLQDRPRALLAATGPTRVECVRLFAAFATACAALYPPDKTWEGKSSKLPTLNLSLFVGA